MDSGLVARRLLLVLFLLALVLWFLLDKPARAGLVLNEVLYDPEGTDGDGEFVELFAAGAESLALAPVRLEFCNGANPGAWELLWSGELRLAPGALFLLAEAGVPGADVVLALDLQNGPEAIRLRLGGETLDLLGYGDGLDPALYEAWPAPDPTGLSLARQPDGVDTNQNALDWFAAPPSPGALNLPAFRAALEAVTPPWLPIAPGAPCSLTVRAANTGAAAWPSSLVLAVDGQARGALPAAAAGERASARIPLPALPAGEHALALVLQDPAGAAADSLSLPLRVGLGPLVLDEVLFAPLTGASEWVECRAREPISGFEDFRLADLGGSEARFRPPPLAAGERLLLCADREALLAAEPGLDPGRVLALSPWPSLANAGSAAQAPGWTDGLRLDSPDGRRADALLYRGDWIPARGVSLERVVDFGAGGCAPWAPCPVGASPLAGSGAPAPAATAGLRLAPNPFDPDRERLWVDLRAPGEALELRIFDAAGRPVQALSGSLGAGLARLVWDGRDAQGQALADGAYPLLARWQDAAGARREQRAVIGLRRAVLR
ncbi:hypothetical protein FJ251_01925 [bacterium]|nr:hypothetical protein [bacterium]